MNQGNSGGVSGVVVVGLAAVVTGALAVVDAVIGGVVVLATFEQVRDLDAIEAEGVEVLDVDGGIVVVVVV